MLSTESAVNSSGEEIEQIKNKENSKISENKIRNSNFILYKAGVSTKTSKKLLNERSSQIVLTPKTDDKNCYESIITVARMTNKQIFAGISWLTMIRINFASIVVETILKYEEEKRANGIDKKNKRIEEFNRTELLLNQARKQDHLSSEQVNKKLNGKNEYNNEFKNTYLPNSVISSIPNKNVDTTSSTMIHGGRTSLENKTVEPANSLGTSAKNRNTKSAETKNNISVANLVNKILPGSINSTTPPGVMKIGNLIGKLPNQDEENADNSKSEAE